MEPKVAASNALEAVLEARPGESILIVTDDVRKDVADAMEYHHYDECDHSDCNQGEPQRDESHD